jgi:H+/Cl- antiporter ClcA
MKIIQKITIVFLIAGIFCGVISYYFIKNFESPFFPLVFPFIIYFVLLSPFRRKMKTRSLIYNSFITFILFWLVALLTLYAL